jgi:putative DNA methylase
MEYPSANAADARTKLLFTDYDRFLDTNRAVNRLGLPAIAALMRRALYFHAGSKYHLLAYTIMPNHAHLLLQPIKGIIPPINPRVEDLEPRGEQADGASPLSDIMHSLKSYTANEANKLLGRSGQFWQHESYDHWVRDDAELERIVAYIDANPIQAGLAKQPNDWNFGSAHDRFLIDGTSVGYLGDLSPSCFF